MMALLIPNVIKFNRLEAAGNPALEERQTNLSGM